MKDTIYRQAAIDAFNTGVDELIVKGKENAEAIEEYLNGVIGRIKDLPPAQLMRWISCSERLPEPNQCVLVSIKGEVDVDWIAVDNTGYGCWYRCIKDVMSVDAWMPLPEPWRGKEHDR